MTMATNLSALQRLRRLRRDQSGAYMIEFALIMPAFLMLVMGIFDIGMQMYAKSVLSGAVEQAARLNTLEANATNAGVVDQAVRDQVGRVARYGTLSFSRQNYRDFSSVGRQEPFTDSNNNGVRNAGECYTDMNNNSTWDADQGGSGQGGASDVVLYRVNLTFNRLFPLWKMLGESQSETITISTVLRNQPYTSQSSNSTVRCT
jgi:Flp pilus assembly protein TadG